VKFESPEAQLEKIKFGVAEFINDGEMLKKLKKSAETGKPLQVKLGADPTRPDIHIGHTVVINKLKTLQDLGHQVVFLIGDFTAMIGDPSGRNATRPLLTREAIEENGRTYAQQIFKILDPEKTQIVYNASWINKMSPAEFVTMTSKYTVARLLERDDFTKRFKSGVPIGMHELIYPLTQGYDSVALKTDLELGGTDQKFNLLVGRDMQAAYGQEPQCVLTMPILEGIDGIHKMSKSLDNYISVIDSPKEMFGKTMRISDELMFRWYTLLTDQSAVQIAQLQKDVNSGAVHPRTAKVNLAKFLIRRFHSAAEAEKAEEEFNRIFVEKGLPDEIPEFQFSVEKEVPLAPLMVKLQLATSNSEASRLIQGGGVSINSEKVIDHRLKISFEAGKDLIIKAGKKKFAKVVIK
jgi:tyrosyl-tRNA synthetase